MADTIVMECAQSQRVVIPTELLSASPSLRKKFENGEIAYRVEGDQTIIKADNITSRALHKVMEYCSMHACPHRFNVTDPARWDSSFIKALEPPLLCELASAAYHLEIKPLVDLSCQAIANQLKGKSPAEIRKTFNICYDFGPEDDAPPPTTRDRLRNKLCDPKRKEKTSSTKSETPSPPTDTRSLEELLQFINDDGKPPPKQKTPPTKPKRTKKDKKSIKEQPRQHSKPLPTTTIPTAKSVDDDNLMVSGSSQLNNSGTSIASDVDDTDDDDVDTEIEEFKMRLESINSAQVSRPKITLPTGLLDLLMTMRPNKMKVG